MGFFNPPSSQKIPSGVPPKDSSKASPSAPPSRPFRKNIAFEHEMNRIVERRFSHLPPAEREYLRAAFSFGRPGQQTRLRPDDYDTIVAGLERNQRDRISQQDISRLKELKRELFN